MFSKPVLGLLALTQIQAVKIHGYFMPGDFGDAESIKAAEARLGQTISVGMNVMASKPKLGDGVDRDIEESLTNIKETENEL